MAVLTSFSERVGFFANCIHLSRTETNDCHLPLLFYSQFTFLGSLFIIILLFLHICLFFFLSSPPFLFTQRTLFRNNNFIILQARYFLQTSSVKTKKILHFFKETSSLFVSGFTGPCSKDVAEVDSWPASWPRCRRAARYD